MKWINKFFDPWVYGTCRGKLARRHKRSGHVQFVLWQAGEQGHKKDYWTDFHQAWWEQFTAKSKDN